MRTRLFLSVAVAALSLSLPPAHAQNAPGSMGREGAKQGESAAPHKEQREEQRQERHGERAQDMNREQAAGQGQHEAARPSKESAEKNEEMTQRPGAASREQERRGATAKEEERRGAAAKEEERRGATANEERRHGAKGESHNATKEHGARQEPGSEKQKQSAEEPGRHGATPAARGSAGRTENERRANGQEQAEPRGENRMGAQEQNRGATERSMERGATRGAERSGENRETMERGATRGAERGGENRETFGAGGRETQAQGGVRLSERQQSRIRQEVEQRGGAHRISRSEFNPRIGAVVPPNVQFFPLPPDVIGLVPQYRGYDYVLVENDVAIIDPATREVVTVLGEGGPPPAVYGYEEQGRGYRGGYAREDEYGGYDRGEYYGRGGRPRARRGEAYGYAPRVRLDNRQERALYRGVMSEARQNLRQVCVRVGDRVPQSVDIEPVPRSIAAEAPDVERYDYFVLNDQVVLVDPDTRVVVDMIPEPR